MTVSRVVGRAPLIAAIALAACAALPARPARAYALVQATSQACEQGGYCETAPTVFGPGMTASLSRFWNFDDFAYLTNTSMTLDYVSLSVFARASGSEAPESGGTFTYSIYRTARSLGAIADVVTAGEGGAPGYFRIPLRVTGYSAVSWQNGTGGTSFGIGCNSSHPGTASVIGVCEATSIVSDGNETFDESVVLDVPIVLGAPFQYQIQVSVEAVTGHAYGDPIPFTGAAEAAFGSEPSSGVLVLDASRNPIPGAPISLGESGFDYTSVPEAPSLWNAVAAAIALRSVRRRARSTA